MSLSLRFGHPHFPDGHKFAINFLGLVSNGETLEIDEDNERNFIANHGVNVEDAFKDNALVTVSGSSALSQDERNQLIAQANPAPTEEEAVAPEVSNNNNEEDPNQLILGGEKNG